MPKHRDKDKLSELADRRAIKRYEEAIESGEGLLVPIGAVAEERTRFLQLELAAKLAKQEGAIENSEDE